MEEISLNEVITKTGSFITETKDFILDTIPTSEFWAEDIAFVLLSNVIGSKIQMPSFVTSKGALKLNVWFLNIAPSRSGFKTLPLDKFVIPLLSRLKTLLPDTFTMEGLIKHMNDSKMYEGSFVFDEFTRHLKNESYNKNFLEDMSRLYSGSYSSRTTVKHSWQEIKDPCVSMLAATTSYIFKLLKTETFSQGFGNRIMIDISDGIKDDISEEIIYGVLLDKRKDDKKTKLPSLPKPTLKPNNGNDFAFKKFMVKKESSIEEWLFNFKTEVIDRIDGFVLLEPDNKSITRLTKIMNDGLQQNTNDNQTLEPMKEYRAASGEFVGKLSGIIAIADLFPKLDFKDIKIKKYNGKQFINIKVEKEHVDLAVEKFDRHLRNMEELLKKWRGEAKVNMFESKETTFERAMNYIEKCSSEDGFFGPGTVSSQGGIGYNKLISDILPMFAETGTIEILGVKDIEELLMREPLLRKRNPSIRKNKTGQYYRLVKKKIN